MVVPTECVNPSMEAGSVLLLMLRPVMCVSIQIPVTAHHNVAVLTYDWIKWTASDLIREIHRALSTKVTSIAIITPGENPPYVGKKHHLDIAATTLLDILQYQLPFQNG